jgi:DNA-binding GntR family transcriptional regulator
MKNKTIDTEQAWKDFEDLLAPQLNFSLADRAVYSHLFRHSRLEGKLQFQLSIPWLARGVGVSSKTARDAVRRLIARGVLHLVERNTQAHHVVRLRLPSEVRAIRAAVNLEEEDFLRTRPLR